MGNNIFQVSSIDAQLRDTPDNLVPHNKKEMERTKNISNNEFSDIYEIRQQCLDFNKACLMSKTESIAKIRKEMQDIAASIQEVTNLIILKQAKYLRDITNCKNLVLAGGCALNCVSNGLILKEGIFENVWIQPAANDS